MPDIVLGEKYRLLEIIGERTNSRVYKAQDLSQSRFVAIKIFKNELFREASPTQIENFLTQLHRLARLNHANLVPIETVERQEIDGELYLYMVTPFATKGSLADRLRTRPLEIMEALAMLYDVCMGLEYAHYQDILHLDLKPQNILFDDYGIVRVADVGISQLLEPFAPPDSEAETLVEEQLDPPWKLNPPQIPNPKSPYQAPEQAQKSTVGPYTDVYALGILLHEMLTGKIPHIDWQSFRHRPHLAAELPVEIKNVIFSATAFEIQYRLQSVDRFTHALKGMVFGATGTPPSDRYMNEYLEREDGFTPENRFEPAFFADKLLIGLLVWSVMMWIGDLFIYSTFASPLLTVCTLTCMMPIFLAFVGLFNFVDLNLRSRIYRKLVPVYFLQLLAFSYFVTLQVEKDPSNDFVGIELWLLGLCGLSMFFIPFYVWGLLPYWVGSWVSKKLN